jgi:putative acetyltransferase
MTLTLRPATATDLAALTALFYNTITTVNAADYDEAQVAAWRAGASNREGWLRRIAEQQFRVAERGETVVGFGSLSNDGYLDLLYVHRDMQRQGIARRLLEELEHVARTRGLSEITSDVSLTARPFFERYGFVVVREQQVVLRGIELTNFKMTKTLP